MASSSSTSTAAKAVFCLSAVGLLYTARWRADNVVRPFGALPRRLVRRIHALDKKACFLLLHFFEEMGYPLKRLMINGGYVRDLLLGRHADDLDITVCLRQCPQLTVETILHDLARFERLEAFGFKSVKVASIIGDASKDKNLDTAKAILVSVEGERVEVDLMPTIGAEVYDEVNRVPVRDHRGTPREDALRRDLTIGAMFITVSLSRQDDSRMDFGFIDYFGGLQDLRRRILRSPCPSPDLQVSWWTKVLKDDPVRIVRVLRFAAKLGFQIHPAFWEAMPEAMSHLKVKVAGSRKLDELLKIAKLGQQKTVHMLALTFRHPGLAEAVLGGKDAKSVPHFLPPIAAFDEPRFNRLGGRLPEDLSAEKLLGSTIALSVFCAEIESQATEEEEGDARERVEKKSGMFMTACAGLCVSRDSKFSGRYLFDASSAVLDGPFEPLQSLDSVFARHTEIPAKLQLSFSFFVLTWNAFKLGSSTYSFQHDVVCGLLPDPVGSQAAVALAMLKKMEGCVPKASGKDLVGLKEIPAHLRGHLLVRMNVLARLNGAKPNLSPSAPLLQDILRELYANGKLKPIYAPPAKG